jgi:hypothetical protein
MSIPKGDDFFGIIRNEINRVEEWLKENFLDLHKQKTKMHGYGILQNETHPN